MLSNLSFNANKISLIKHPDYYNYSIGLTDVDDEADVWKMNAYDVVLNELQSKDLESIEPENISKEDALLVHTPKYIETVFGDTNKNRTAWAGGPWDQSAQRAVLRSSGGMIKNNEEALNRGISIQMYDAFHHAYPNKGEGFCVLNDVAIAATKYSRLGKKIMIVDTDVHQGQGTAVCTQKD